MSLAKSYANLRKHGHKMAAGGMCEACGGKACMWGGGMAEKKDEKPAPSPDPIGDEDKRKKISDSFKSVFAGGGKVKGVNKPESDNIQGVSRAGAHLRDVRFAEKGSSLKKAGMSVAKNLHKETLKEMEDMPNPKLRGLAKGGEVGSRKENHAYNFDATQEQKGVHKVLPRYEKGKGMKYGESTGNSNWKGTGLKTAKGRHKEVLEELKDMPNPKLKGLAGGGKVKSGYEHELEGRIRQSEKAARETGSSDRKGDLSNTSKENREHHEKMMKSTYKKKLADGGKVSGFDLNDQAVANWMSEGKMTGEAEGGEIDSDNESMLEQCAGELIEAFESKNKKEILDSIKAIVLSLKG